MALSDLTIHLSYLRQVGLQQLIIKQLVIECQLTEQKKILTMLKW